MKKDTDNSMGFERHTDGDPDWMAWCFITGELSDDEASDFLVRLESDPEVVQAVARAVELYSCCEAGLEGPRPVVGRLPEAVFADNGSPNGRVRLGQTNLGREAAAGSWRKTVALSLAAVVLLLVSVAIRWGGEAVQRANDEAMLAAVWAGQLHDSEPWDESWDPVLVLDDGFDLLTAVEREAADLADTDGQGWIFAAAIALDGLDLDSGGDEQLVF